MAKIRSGKPKKRGWLSQVLFTLSLIFLVFGLFQLGWAVWPSARDAVQIIIPGGVLPGAPSGETFTSLADYTLNLSWPRWIRSGQDERILMSIMEVADEKNPQIAEREAQIILVEPVIANLSLTPPGRMQTSIAAGQNIEMSWDVEGEMAGEFTGKVYVAFGFYDDVLAEVVPVPVAVVDISIRVVSLWGLSANLAIWLGFVSLVLWGALFILGRLAQGR
jgi:hypothetical protein